MNTIYRIVWNRSRQAWEVASELARRGHGGADSVAAGTACGGRLRRLPLALGYVLGGCLMVAAMPVHAGDTEATQMHQRMQKVDTRLADLSDLMVKYDDGAAAPRATSVPERQPTPATSPASRSGATTMPSSVATVPADSRVLPDAAPTPPVPAVRSDRVKPAVAISRTTSPPNARSPHLASDAQIAAVLAARGGHAATAAGTEAGSESVWVVDSDGVLRVTKAGETAPAPVTPAPRVATAATPTPHASGVMAPGDAVMSADGDTTVARAAASPPLPDIDVERTATIRMPSTGALAIVSTDVPVSVPDMAGRVVDAAGLPPAPEPVPAPLPPRPDPVMKQSLVADVAHPAGDAAVASQTSSLVLDVNPSDVNVAVAGMDRARGSLDPAADLADAGTATAGDSGRIIAAAVDEPVPYRFSSDDSQGMTFSSSSMRGSAMAVTPMALPPGDPRRPRPIETPAPGLIVSNNGLVGGALGLLGNSTDSLFNGGGSEHYVSSGSLRVSNANFSQAYGVTSALGVPLVNLTPVGSVLKDLDGDLVGGTGSNSHLTLIGGVTSGNYIHNINNGAAGGLLGLLLPDEAPDWASECMNILGLVKTECWGVNAAQDYQVLVGDGASANGSKEVVIGTNASHTLAEVDAEDAFPGDGRNDKTNPSGVPTSDYAARLGHSVVIGDDASGSKNGQTILGAEATSDQANSVALGYQSEAARGGNPGYTDAYGLQGLTQVSAGEVAVGHAGSERQITHVAAGTEDHDAVNVMQLKGAVSGAVAGAVLYDVDAGGDPVNHVTLTGDGTGAPVGIGNLAAGEVSATSTDAVNGAQLAASNTAIVDYFGGTTAYDPTTNTFTGPTFSITDVDRDGNTTSNDYDNATDAFAAVDSSVTTVNDRVTNIYETGVKYFHANSTGADSDAAGTDAIAVGPAATAGGTDAIAIGNGADAGMDGSIALGSGSVTRVGAQTDYTAYGLSTPQTSVGEVNVGNRQVTGVAAGSADDDAVNVAQLKGVADVASSAVQYDGPDKTQVTLAGPASTDGGLTDGTVITNLHQGEVSATSTDAVNGSQLFGTNDTVARYFGGVTSYDGSTNTWTPPNFTITQIDTDGSATSGDYDNVTDAFAAVDGSLTNINKRITDATGDLKYFHANSNGADAEAAGDRSVAMGGDAVAQGSGSVAAGDGAQAATDGAVAIGQQASADGGQAVAIGNGAQASGDGAVSIGDPNVVVGDGAVGLGKDNQVTGDGAIALGQNNQAVGEGAVAFGNAAQASADGALALGNEANASVAGGIALGAGSVADRTGTGQEAFTGVAVPGTGAVSVGADGQERQITHVAGGTEDTDAVNLRQLREVDSRIGILGDLAVLYDDAGKTQVTLNNGGSAVLLTHVADGEISATSLDAINGSQLYFWTQDTGNTYSNYSLYQQIQNLTNSDEFAVNNTDNLPKADAQGDNSAAGGAGTVAAGNDSTALGNGAQAEGDNSVALGAGSVATRDNAVSVGSKGHERQVTHVAAGSEDTDAVNMAQLKQSTAGTVQYDKNKDGSVDYGSITLGATGARSAPTVVRNVGDGKADTDAVNVRQLHAGVQEAENWAKNYTDEQISGLSRQLNDVGNKAYAGVASAMAMAGLPQAYLPGKNMVSIAGSSFHGESSVAVGVSMISEGGKWVYKLNGTDNSRGDAGVSVGVGFQW